MERRKPAAIDRATALRYMGASGWTPDAATAALLDKAEQTVLTAAAPRAVYRRLPRTALPLENCGSDLTRHLQGCDEVLLLAATLGAEVDGPRAGRRFGGKKDQRRSAEHDRKSSFHKHDKLNISVAANRMLKGTKNPPLKQTGRNLRGPAQGTCHGTA